MAHYAFLNNDYTTLELRKELSILWSEMSNLTSIEEPTQEDMAAIEAKQEEINAKQQEIDNALCMVTHVITGVEETYIKYARTDFAPSDLDEIIDNTEYWEGYYGKGGLCKRTSYNTIGGAHQNGGTPFRKNYAGVGYTYDPVRDAFYAPQPYGSWTLNEDTCLWECPVEKPEGEHWWIEESQEWIEPIEQPEGKTFFHTGEKMWITTQLDSIKPYPSWVIEDVDMSPRVFTHSGLSVYSTWVAPVEKPNDGKSYLWDEETLTWVLAE